MKKQCAILFWLIINLIMDLSSQVLIHFFLRYVKTIANRINKLEHYKLKLSQTVLQIEDYIKCFKHIDLDKKGVIYPNILQTFLIQNKYYYPPVAINRYFSKYSHEKAFLAYEDILEALLPHSNFILVSHTISNPSQYLNKSKKYSYESERGRIQSIKHMTALIISEEIKCQNQDYEIMRQITRNNLSIGATIWRLLDHNHDNLLNYDKVNIFANKFEEYVQEHEWNNFLYWHFHSYKRSINRQDFMRIIDIQEKKKRATSACKIDQYHVQNDLLLKGQQQRSQNQKIKDTIQKKLTQMANFSKPQSKLSVWDKHFLNEQLYIRKELKGPKGYSVPRNTIKSVIQKYDPQQ